MTRLKVKNFLAIRNADFGDLSSCVVVAGANGSGKSCLLDAVRLIKSACGSYMNDEWNAFFGERQTDLNRDPAALLNLFRDRSKPVEIEAWIEFTADELAFISSNAERLSEDMLARERWEADGTGRRRAQPGSQRDRALIERAKTFAAVVVEQCKMPRHGARLRLVANERPDVYASELLRVAFSTYEPASLGIVDFHGPTRTYGRQRVSAINLTIDASEDQNRPHALYNYSNKYANIKTEMGSAFVRHLLSKEASNSRNKHDELTETLQELFSTFFPGKEFVGPTPTSDGKLLFPVRLEDGAEHDIDDLSSGEKEVLFGYLRMKNSAIRNSILLLDEPELHLNPKLVSGLAGFYERHISAAFSNQLWLVTHSDALIRDAIESSAYSVYHLQHAGTGDENQLERLALKQDVDRAVVHLVGDMAAYRPRAKVVLVESSGEAEFDAALIRKLFPTIAKQINLVSAGSKSSVGGLHTLLEQVGKDVGLSDRFYSIADRDSDAPRSPTIANRFVWPVYHIENFLLQDEYIAESLASAGYPSVGGGSSWIEEALKQCASEVVERQVRHQMRVSINGRVLGSVSLAIHPEDGDAAVLFGEALTRSWERLGIEFRDLLNQQTLRELHEQAKGALEQSLLNGAWRTEVSGRNILTRFVLKHCKGMAYARFRDLIVSQMARANWQPIGMREPLERIAEIR